jgi:LPS export ABC transporter protein LptC
MRRIRLRAALLVVVAAALGGLGYLVSRTIRAHRPDRLRAFTQDLLPDVAQHIRNFRRVRVEDDRAVWEITATDARYLDDASQILVSEPRMTFFLEGGQRQAHIAGAEGRILLDGHDVRTLTLRGGVALRLDDFELQTEEATYDRARDLITSSVDVTIRGRRLEVRGRGMEVEIGPQHMRLLDAVRTTVLSDAAAS